MPLDASQPCKRGCEDSSVADGGFQTGEDALLLLVTAALSEDHHKDATECAELAQKLNEQKVTIGLLAKMEPKWLVDGFNLKFGEAASLIFRATYPSGQAQAHGSALEDRIASHFRDLQSKLEFVELNIKFMLLAALTFPPESSATLRDEEFRHNIIRYQGSSVCCVLSQRFPESYKQYLRWRRGPRLWSSQELWECDGRPFPAIADHILPNRCQKEAALMGIELQDKSNGLMLFRHLERKYGLLEMSFIPSHLQLPGTDEMKLELHVAKKIMDEPLVFQEPRALKGRQVEVLFEECHAGAVYFRDLHATTLVVKKVSLRSLFLKALCAHVQNPDLPDPREYLDRFNVCCKWTGPWESLGSSRALVSP